MFSVRVLIFACLYGFRADMNRKRHHSYWHCSYHCSSVLSAAATVAAVVVVAAALSPTGLSPPSPSHVTAAATVTRRQRPVGRTVARLVRSTTTRVIVAVNHHGKNRPPAVTATTDADAPANATGRSDGIKLKSSNPPHTYSAGRILPINKTR